MLKRRDVIESGNFSNGLLNDSLCFVFYAQTGVIKYKGNYKKGLPDGKGKYFSFDGSLIYDGEWKEGKYDGFGTLYSDKAVIYKGEWSDGKYDGKGILYVNGEAHTGKWSKGHEEISVSKQIKDVINIVTNNKNESRTRNSHSNLYSSHDVFLDSLSSQFADHVERRIKENVEDRFGVYDALFRIPVQSIFCSQAKRMEYANEKLTEGLKAQDLQDWINGKIYDYNKHVKDSDKLKTISLKTMDKNTMVDEAVFSKLIERENLENTDNIVYEIIWGIINLFCFIFGFKFISKSGWVILVDAVQTVILFLLIEPEIENNISSLISQNYIEYISKQDIIQQIYE